RLEAFDGDLDAHGQRVLVPAAADEGVRRAAFDRPTLYLAVGALHFDVDPGVRVAPLHLDDRALYRDGLVRVELGRERVVRENRCRSRNEQHGAGDDVERFRTHGHSIATRRAYFEGFLFTSP